MNKRYIGNFFKARGKREDEFKRLIADFKKSSFTDFKKFLYRL